MVDEDTIYTLEGPRVQVIFNILEEPRKSIELFCPGVGNLFRRLPLSIYQNTAALAISLAMRVRDVPNPRKEKKKD